MSSYMDGFYEQVESMGVVPVVVLDRVEDALPLADVLVKGGLPSAEVTFRTDAAADSIKAMAEQCPDILVGAGTVLNVAQADTAIDAGAKFIVSPGYDAGVVARCIEREIPVLPGTVTPTEVTAAINQGLSVTKFFPAAQYGGLATISALAAPFVGHRFMPTGGVNTSNLAAYLDNSSIIACGGTWMVKPDLIKAGEFEKILKLTSDAAALVAKIRG
jgi:2-dehydro-3-deoxyphosphogluconate aldolase/(4S)-4-hydroxy-2-oxoglutarate aldolase